jgi:type IV pilus assembly protein PilY1
VANTGVTGSNGMSSVLARDSNGDGFVDTAYAGDRRGNLWKFTGLSGSASATKIFEARDPSGVVQPITAAPLVGKDPDTGAVWVFFGTGSYLTTNDLSDRQVQTWYGIKDAFIGTGSRSDLVDRDIISETRKNSLDVRVVEDGAVGDLVGRRGWFMDLVPPSGGALGERMVVPNRFQGVALIGTTRIPEAANPCSPTGKGFIMAINPFTGARLADSFFDVTRDSVFDNADMESVDRRLVPVSGIGFGSSSNNPIFVEDTMQVSLDPGTTETIKVQGSSSDAGRMSWREIVN